jgi:hypothetical protein
MKNFGTPTRFGYSIPLDDGEGGVFMFVKPLIRCRDVTFSRVHVGGGILYEYSDEGGTGRYYFLESRQLECFDLFVEMAVFEVTGEFYKYLAEELAERVAELRNGERSDG